MSDPCVLGIDFGTESVRVGVFTPDGKPIIFRTQSYRLSHPRPGWAEQSSDEWWQSLRVAVHQALSDGHIDADSIVGIGTDTTSCTVLALDKDARPLRPAILWMDLRAASQAQRIAASGHPALKYNGYGSRVGRVAAVQGAVAEGKRAGRILRRPRASAISSIG